MYMIFRYNESQIRTISPKLANMIFVMTFLVNMSCCLALIVDTSSEFSCKLSDYLLIFSLNILQILSLAAYFFRLYRLNQLFDEENFKCKTTNIKRPSSNVPELSYSVSIHKSHEKAIYSSRVSRVSGASNDDCEIYLISKGFLKLIKERYYVLLVYICVISLILSFFAAFYFLEHYSISPSSIFPIWIQAHKMKVEDSYQVVRYCLMTGSVLLSGLVIVYTYKFLSLKTPKKIDVKTEFKVSFIFLIFSELIIKFSYLLIPEASQKYCLYAVVTLNICFVSVTIWCIHFLDKTNLLATQTKECATNFNLLLITEICYQKFYDFLKNYQSGNGAKYLQFYTQLSVFKNYSKTRNAFLNTQKTMQKSNNLMEEQLIVNPDYQFYSDTKINLSKKSKERNMLTIYQKYLEPNSPNYVEIPNELSQAIYASYLKKNKNSYSPEWDKILYYLFNSLKNDYYDEFIKSREFEALIEELDEEERLHSRFALGSIIEN